MAISISDHKTFSAGAGVSILTAIAGIFSTWLRANPVYLYVAGAVGLALLLWPLLHSLWVGRKKLETPVATTKMKAGGDIDRSPQIGVVHGNVHIGDTETSKKQPAPIQASPKLSIKPVVVISETSEPQFLKYDPEDEVFAVDKHGKRMLVIPISNPLPHGLEESILAERISVHLNFSSHGSFMKDIERAYWVGESANEVEIETGKKKFVLIGVSRDNEWCSFENVYSYAHRSSGWGSGYRNWRMVTEKTVPFPPHSVLYFQVSVLHTARSGKVSAIAQKQFSLKVIPGENIYYCEVVKP